MTKKETLERLEMLVYGITDIQSITKDEDIGINIIRAGMSEEFSQYGEEDDVYVLLGMKDEWIKIIDDCSSTRKQILEFLSKLKNKADIKIKELKIDR